jgi:hypothetical protein
MRSAEIVGDSRLDAASDRVLKWRAPRSWSPIQCRGSPRSWSTSGGALNGALTE